MEPAIYLHSDTYEATIQALVNAARHHEDIQPVSDLRSLMIEVLGEAANIWPMSIFAGEDEGRVIVAS